MLRTIGLLAVAVFAVAGLAACGDDDDERSLLEQAQEDGITIGIANERPYGYEDGGVATGEAPELARVVFERMGITEVDFEVVDFGGLINGLNAGRFDVIAAGMFINPERAQQVAFADPDYCGTTAFAVPEGNPKALSDFASITSSGATVGVVSGAVEEGYATGNGVPDGQIESFQTTPDVFDALVAGRIDAVALTAITVRSQVADLPGFEATPGFVPEVDGEPQLGCGAFAFRYDDVDFRDAFNEELRALRDEGGLLPVIEPFGFTSAEVDAAAGLTVDDLAGGES